MSTFKRLLNVGKGKLKVATRPAPPPAPDAPDDEDWLTDARHKVADAVEGVADAIRPEAASPARATRTGTSERPAPEAPTGTQRAEASDRHGAPTEHAAPSDDAAPAKKGPVKRHL